MSRKLVLRQVTAVALWLIMTLVPSMLANDTLWANLLTRVAIVSNVLLLSYAVETSRHQFLLFITLLAVLAICTTVYSLIELPLSAWLLVITWFALLLLLGRQLRLIPLSRRYLRRVWHLLTWVGMSATAGIGLAIYDAILSHFAEEEFFIASSGVYLSLFWLIMVLGYELIRIRPAPLFALITQPKRAIPITICSAIIITLVTIPWVLKQYQRSFFPLIAPTYTGISTENPFLCEQITEVSQPIPGEEITQTFIALLEANPQKNTLSWGNLALYTGQADYAAKFRHDILQEAAQSLYTSPAHSIKWGQYQAALRAHQLILINSAFPDLFSNEEQQRLLSWFSTINHRAMTIEWVDWLYAAAYGKRPEGPYENQEIGSGLLAVLMSNNLAADYLKEQNSEYLNRVPLGWEMIFRNTDDSYFYQDIWLANALWIHQFRELTGHENAAAGHNINLSLLWLLILGLPNGESLAYNIHVEPSMASAYLLGATLIENPQLSWLAGKVLQRLADEGKFLPGDLALTNLALPDGQIPTIGSCLVFGNSGVPTTKGPLGPDKVIFRDGWSDEAVYALKNLRFTGWHRYKATNTIPLIYQQGPLVSERWTPEDFWWLPAGRSAFRDKRVPREYLNGFIISKSGLPKLLWRISGVGSTWAQDPPAYAEVDIFFTSSTIDMSTTRIEDWHGWRQQRTIYHITDGLILVVDHATATSSPQPASLIWHVNGEILQQTNTLTLSNEHRLAQVTWPEIDTPYFTIQTLPPDDAYFRSPDWELLYTSPHENELKTAIAFLTKMYTQGTFEITYVGERQGLIASWSASGQAITLLHNFSDQDLETEILKTDGAMLAYIRDETETQLCYAGGETIHVRLTDLHTPKAIIADSFPLDRSSWHFTNEWLTITVDDQPENGCLQLQN